MYYIFTSLLFSPTYSCLTKPGTNPANVACLQQGDAAVGSARVSARRGSLPLSVPREATWLQRPKGSLRIQRAARRQEATVGGEMQEGRLVGATSPHTASVALSHRYRSHCFLLFFSRSVQSMTTFHGQDKFYFSLKEQRQGTTKFVILLILFNCNSACSKSAVMTVDIISKNPLRKQWSEC